jgi:spoIIIJ-associated protein
MNRIEKVQDLVEAVVDAMDLDVDVAVEAKDDEIHVHIDGDELGPVIGRDGRVIDALQHLAFKAASTEGAGPRVIVDAGDYRERRRKSLERQADEAADDALANSRQVALDPTSAIERKVVHEYLRDRGDVETWSEGVEPDRHLVVAPLGSAPPA